MTVYSPESFTGKGRVVSTKGFAWAVVWCVAVAVLVACGESASRSDRPVVVIGEETTFVTGPVTADGRVDFVAAYNEFAGAGVTRETNAAAALVEAIGMPDYLANNKSAAQAQAVRLLGVTPGKPRPTVYLDSDLVHSGPWKASDSPEAAEAARQLAQLQVALDAGVAATRRPHWFFPAVTTDDPANPLAIPVLSSHRSLAKLLVARGFLRLGEGDAPSAWRDIQAASRLGRHLRQEPHLFGLLVAMAGTALSDVATQRLALHVTDRAILEEMLRDVADRPVQNADRTLWGQRLFDIAILLTIWHDPGKHNDLFDNFDVGTWRELSEAEEKRVVAAIWQADPNVVLRAFNRMADERDALLRMDDRAGAMVAHKAYDARRIKMENSLLDRLPALNASPEEKTQWCADAAGTLDTMPWRIRDLLDRVEQTRRITMTVVALELHKLDHGAYPDSLDALSPAYLQAVPTDLYTGRPMIYRVHDDTYDLYSVGHDGIDDGGMYPNDILSETMRIRDEALEQ